MRFPLNGGAIRPGPQCVAHGQAESGERTDPKEITAVDPVTESLASVRENVDHEAVSPAFPDRTSRYLGFCSTIVPINVKKYQPRPQDLLDHVSLAVINEADNLHLAPHLVYTIGSTSYTRLISLAQVDRESGRGPSSSVYAVLSGERPMQTAAVSVASSARSFARMPRCRCEYQLSLLHDNVKRLVLI